jgi:hypothetical protein
MKTIVQTLEVAAPAPVVSDSWKSFMEWVLVGDRRLACDQLMCVDAVAAGMVRFEPAGDDRTLVSFEVPVDGGPTDGDGLRTAIDDRLRLDLLRFRDYVENADRLRQAGPVGRDAGAKRPAARHDLSDAGSVRPADPMRGA